jgi:deoxyxylulose-5-phosphate synthase
VVTVEEGTVNGGFGSAVADLFTEEEVVLKRFAIPDRFIPHGNRSRLLKDIGLTPEAVAAYVSERLGLQKIVQAEEKRVLSTIAQAETTVGFSPR